MIDLETNFVAKKELFVFPFGIYFRWMGGVAIDRSMGDNRVERIAKIFGQQKLFRLAIAPEGTRKAVEKWKTGFYYIAHTAQIPLVLCRIDWGEKKISFSEPMMTTGDIAADFPKIKTYFLGAKGKADL
ncbi:hypothetical protein GCM10009117_02290 [Gangjinia marincola]|uniref:Phospholipid/glycerol acyltransferase domain-containing protein n=2 Tax=Gangjinia marincola TaxID=578463 RepID=A0ABP3XPA5_9FLAO